MSRPIGEILDTVLQGTNAELAKDSAAQRSPLGPDDSLLDEEGEVDSLAMMASLEIIESEFGLHIPERYLDDESVSTLRELVELAVRLMEANNGTN